MSGRWARYGYDLRTLPRDARRAWRTGGLGGVWFEVRRRTLDRLWVHSDGLVIEIDLPDGPLPPPPLGIVVTRFTGPDWSRLGELTSERLHPRLAEAAAAGRHCYVAWRGMRAVGYTWASPALERRHEGFVLPLPADAVYLWQTQVVASERSRGVGAAVVRAAAHAARAAGARRAWMVIHPANRSSLRVAAAVNRTGCRVLGTVRRVQLLSSARSRFEPYVSPRPLLAELQ
jgi:GNAT superfamily N-acetyltransferase